MRTQEEILKRFNDSEDMFGTQQSDLIDFMTFENAKPYLTDEYVQKVINGEAKYEVETDAKCRILNYLDFAYKKARDQRGLSAARSMLHFRTWIWLDNNDFYQEIESEIDDYDGYGIPVLDKISKHYGFVYA